MAKVATKSVCEGFNETLLIARVYLLKTCKSGPECWHFFDHASMYQIMVKKRKK